MYHVTHSGEVEHVIFGGTVCNVPVLSEVLQVQGWYFVGSPFMEGLLRFKSDLLSSGPCEIL